MQREIEETIDARATAGNAGDCATSKRPRVGPKDRNKNADGTGLAAYEIKLPSNAYSFASVRCPRSKGYADPCELERS
jgi:hypothetical protein